MRAQDYIPNESFIPMLRINKIAWAESVAEASAWQARGCGFETRTAR